VIEATCDTDLLLCSVEEGVNSMPLFYVGVVLFVYLLCELNILRLNLNSQYKKSFPGSGAIVFILLFSQNTKFPCFVVV
jgi:hypothetical protein